eukprot:TRINITY_DN4659_c0_g1_i3.p1 TRINITY_DN4659_c0_g1~~TRINITY_DN4659_c0_g1_i3.p1  ORF type:complete len:131 (+),score=26.55 TRINITY_DN4659_c0_g1_i3:186-578(+)
MLIVNENAARSGGLFFFGTMLFHCEVSVSSLSMLLFNHAISNFTVLLLCESKSHGCLLMSALTVMFFCYRRSRPLDSGEQSELTAKCASLLRLVLESGDDLCADSQETLQEVIALPVSYTHLTLPTKRIV